MQDHDLYHCLSDICIFADLGDPSRCNEGHTAYLNRQLLVLDASQLNKCFLRNQNEKICHDNCFCIVATHSGYYLHTSDEEDSHPSFA